MKKIYFFFAILSSCFLVQGQPYLFEGFGSGTWPPAGWTPLPLGPQWSLSQTSNAGGISPEARLQGFSYTGTVRLMSPLIDLTGADTVILSFRYFAEINDTAAPLFGVSTRTGGNPWDIVWETTLINRNEPREFEVLFIGNNMGHPDFQFSFFLEGDMTMLFNLYLDNIRIYYPTATDGKLDEILTPAHVEGPVPVDAKVLNLGNTTISEVMVSWLTNTGVRHDSLFTGLNLRLYESFTFQFDRWWVSPFGDYDLKMWISSVNGQPDPSHPNDTLVKLINYSLPPRPMRIPCLETFTAAWCQPCAIWAESYDPWCEDHPYNVVIKYQMGDDPYATPEGYVRLDYYDLDAIPYTYCNGKLACNVDTNKLDTAYFPACKLHSDFIINSSFTLDESVITITNNIFPYITTTGTRVQTIVIEKTTYDNVMGNGQTEFHNVEMEMFPGSGEGEIVNFYSNLPYSHAYTADLDTTHVEELDDLLVAVFIQQDSNREILQSAYSLEDGVYSAEDRLSMITLDGVPLAGFNPDVYTYDVEIPQSAVESPVVCGIPVNEKEMVLTQQAFDIVGPAVIDVYPESRGSMARYIVNFSFATDIGDHKPAAMTVFPNPVDGKLFLAGINIAKAKLYSLDGKLLLNTEKISDNFIDLSGMKKGIYLLNLINEDGTLIVKKIIVM
jgi:hypothetical protein